jgi:hypothetical protein
VYGQDCELAGRQATKDPVSHLDVRRDSDLHAPLAAFAAADAATRACDFARPHAREPAPDNAMFSAQNGTL